MASAHPSQGLPSGMDPSMVDEYASQSKLLQEFVKIPSIGKAWVFTSKDENASRAMVSVSQSDLLANKKRSFLLNTHISKGSSKSASFQWSPFPVEMSGVSAVVPSPSGEKLLLVRNAEDDDSPTKLEIWGPCQLENEIHVARSVHGSLYADGWFEGISWNQEETLIAYVAEEPPQPKPEFNDSGYRKEGSSQKDYRSWKGQGDTEDNWGETYSNKRIPALFVANITSGEVRALKGIPRSLSAGQVIWAPSSSYSLVFVAWSDDNGFQETPRKLGIKYCYNRPCALYAAADPFKEEADKPSIDSNKGDTAALVKLTADLSSAFFPRFRIRQMLRRQLPSWWMRQTNRAHPRKIAGPEDGGVGVHRPKPSDPEAHRHPGKDRNNQTPKRRGLHTLTQLTCPDGKYLVFISAKSAVDSGAHNATNSMHKIDWPTDGKLEGSLSVSDVVPTVMSPQDGCFPGMYCSGLLRFPWLSDGRTMILSSAWGSKEVILSINVASGEVSRVSPQDSDYSWNVLALDNNNILAVSSSLVTLPQMYYGFEDSHTDKPCQWDWQEIPSPFPKPSDKVSSLLADHKFSVIKIPVSNPSDKLPDGANLPFEAIFVSGKDSASSPTIVVLHGGPHSVYPSSYSRSLAFLYAQGYNLLVVNYRGSLGFGEEALQSLPGNIGSQDVNDVLTALDFVKKRGLIDASRVAVVGGSHGGFLTTHLIGQAPETFVAAAARNPVCNLQLMVGTTDIPDWCFLEVYGKEGKNCFTESPLADSLTKFYQKSPISHISKVKTPTLFLLGAKDLRVPVSNGLQYARALKERGVDTKIIVFPEDIHGLDKFVQT
ncbi:unnamed protein product [Triticum turgidum subsp. durum]|uniref:acylaminoacyl-peptidase n=1 Tax=Triticum turgidum subsp. durum TaxID=4567 RepID=A0A9R0V1N9_TRITD|nr:unnamed protein product [Triticum turgidum subsp. durum]